MKKFLFLFLLLTGVVTVYAQDFYSEYAIKTEGFSTVAKIDENTRLVQIATDKENFDLSLINDQLKEKWRVTLSGAAAGAGTLEGNIIAIGYTSEHSQITYTAYLVDKATGKTLLQKTVYQAAAPGESTEIVFGDKQGSVFHMALCETGSEAQIKSVVRVDINGKLEASVYSPAGVSGAFIHMAGNDNGDLFVISSQEDAPVSAYRCQAGKSAADNPVTQDMDLKKKLRKTKFQDGIAVSPSNKNIVYFAAAHESREKEQEMTVAKFDFGSHTSQIASIPLDKATIKSLQKNAYKPEDQKFKTNLGDPSALGVMHIEEAGNTVLVSLSGAAMGSYQIGGGSLNAANTANFIYGTAIIVTAFDLNLQQRFQLVLPCYYQWYHQLKNAFHSDGKNLYVIMTNSVSYWKKSVSYAAIDLATGNVVNYQTYEDNNHIMDNEALWFKNVFVIPFSTIGGTFAVRKETIDLLSYKY